MIVSSLGKRDIFSNFSVFIFKYFKGFKKVGMRAQHYEGLLAILGGFCGISPM